MDERTRLDGPDDHLPPVGADAPTEVVRMAGAGEVVERGAPGRSGSERGAVGSRRSEGRPRYGDRPESPPADSARPTLRFPLAGGEAEATRPRVSPSQAATSRRPAGATSSISSGRTRPGSTSSADRGSGPADGDPDLWSGSGSGQGSSGGGGGGGGGGGEVAGSDLHGDETRVGARDAAPGPDELFTFGDDASEPPDATGSGVDDAVAGQEPAPGAPARSRGRRPRRAPGAGGGARSSRAAQPGTDRNLPLAIGVGVALAVVAIVAMTLGPAYGVAFTTAIVTLCAGELFGALRKAGHQPATLLGLAATAALVTAAYWKGEPALPLVLVLTVVFTLLWYLVGVSRSSPTVNGAVTILTVGYVGLFGSFAALMLRLPNGTGILLGTVLAVVANDVGALFAGRRFGRRPIAAAISPNKTIEGALGGAAASVVVSYLVLDLIGLHPWEAKAGAALALGLLVAVLAPIGDLVESMLKRDLEVKDMGSILPGHGGLIDRFDALLLVLPAAYYLCRLLEIT